MTKLETEVFNLLRSNQINFKFEATKRDLEWLKGMSLDFYLKDYNIAIECQGIQHFEPIERFGGKEDFNKTIKRDKLKYKLCNENNIRLLYYSFYTKEDYIDKIYHNQNELIEEINKIILSD